MSTNRIIILNEASLPLARHIQTALGGSIDGLSGRVGEADTLFSDTRGHIQKCFGKGDIIIAVMASGALIRLLAPMLADKTSEPPVLVVSEDGSNVVPLLGGHHGANDLARHLADTLGGRAAITTAGDIRFGVALDNPPQDFVLANPLDAKKVMAELAGGAKVKLNGSNAWLEKSGLPFSQDGNVVLTTTEKETRPGPLELVFHPRSLVVGLGCERGTETKELIALAKHALASARLSPMAIACVASIDVKADETGVHGVAEHFGVGARFFSAATLEQETPRLKNPSDIVFAEVGCHGVSEGAALAAGGSQAALVVPKLKSARGTVAIARAPAPMAGELMGRSRGKLFVVGIGPGQEGWRSPEVTRMIEASSDLVGYSLYLDLIDPITTSQKRHDFDLGREEDRVRHAMELAGQGRDVALVCSGDAGIYAMATLVFELLAHGGLTEAAKRIAIEVSPGISALQGAAARAGAPLGHDFCTISLSDLLTPWEAIKMRVKAAAEGDFVIAFYNPVSKRRRTQLAHAKEVLLQHRPGDTPVILASNLGRPGEKVRVVPLQDLVIDEVDMLTVVVVGSSETRTVKTGDGRTWVYTPRGYSAKSGTGIETPANTAAAE